MKSTLKGAEKGLQVYSSQFSIWAQTFEVDVNMDNFHDFNLWMLE